MVVVSDREDDVDLDDVMAFIEAMKQQCHWLLWEMEVQGDDD